MVSRSKENIRKYTQAMKKIFVVSIALLLSGCALWDAYFMAPYDANEYLLITEIRVEAGQYRAQCANPAMAPVNAEAMSRKTDLYEKYSEQIPRNQNGYKSAQALNQIAQGLATAYDKGPVSATFCRLKYVSIENSATLIQRVTAGRPR
jgi:hypothetical protein